MFSYSPVQNGAVTQKDTLNDDEFEPYLNTQARQVRNIHCLLRDTDCQLTFENFRT